MRTIERTSQFKKDYKRECKGQHRLTVESELVTVLKQLIADKPLAAKYRVALNRILQIMKELGLTPGHRVGVVKSITPESLAMEAFLAGP